MSKLVVTFTDVFIPKFVIFIIIIKIFFILFAVGNLILNKSKKMNTVKDSSKSNKKKVDESVEFTKKWKERTEFIFTISMAILLIIVFNPWFKNEHYLNREIKLLFYLFGWILIVTSKWKAFITEAPWI